MYQSIFGSFLASDLLTTLIIIVMTLGLNFWIFPMIKENKKLKKQLFEKINSLPSIQETEKSINDIKEDFLSKLESHEAQISINLKAELGEYLKSIKNLVKDEIGVSSSIIEKHVTNIENFYSTIIEYHNDIKTRIEKNEANLRANKYQYANVIITLEKIITICQEFSNFFINATQDLEKEHVLGKIDISSLREINKILVSINNESMKIMVKIKAEQDEFEKMIAE